MIWYKEFKIITGKGTPFLLLFFLADSVMLNLTFLISEFINFSGYSHIKNHSLIFSLFRFRYNKIYLCAKFG